MTNAEIARNLERLADLSELDGDNPFKVRAYRNASAAIRELDTQLADMLTAGQDLTTIKGIGKEIAEKSRVMIETGALPQLVQLTERLPVGLLEIVKIKGVGPKQAATVWEKLGVSTVDELEKAAKDGRLAGLPGFGAKTIQNLMRGIESYRRNLGRTAVGKVDAVIAPLVRRLLAVPGLRRLEIAGSHRRRRESVGDIDLVATTSDPQGLAAAFTGYDEVATVLGSGATKSSIELFNGLQVDLRIVDESSFGAALLYFTGSKEHNVALRQRSLDRGWHLNEYGLFEGGEPGRERAGGKLLAGEDEASIYRALGLDYIEPELREGRGEIEAAAAGTLPTLLQLDDLRGDMHMHTTWSDGKQSASEMVDACAELGYEYLAITDHSGSLVVQGGLTEEKLQRQHQELDEITENSVRDGVTVLRGMEVDILKDGSLDLSDEWLERLDIVLISVHSFFELSRAEQTARVVKALSHPQVNVYAHPTGRLIGRRDPIELDFDEVFAACAANGVAVEHNSSPSRLDLRDTQLRDAVTAGLKVVINTDAHSTRGLATMALGVSQARRAWLTKADVVNTWPLADVRRFLAKTP